MVVRDLHIEQNYDYPFSPSLSEDSRISNSSNQV